MAIAVRVVGNLVASYLGWKEAVLEALRTTLRGNRRSRAIALIAFPLACSRRIRTTVSTTNIRISPSGKPGSLLHHRNEGSLLDADHPANGVPFARRSTVVPASGALEVQAKMLNKDVGFVREGQEVAVKLEAFPFTRFGTVPGRVRSISRDAVQDKDLGLVYVVTVALDRDFVVVGGRQLRLAPGLAAIVDVKTGARRIINYLLSPLQTTVSQAGRER